MEELEEEFSIDTNVSQKMPLLHEHEDDIKSGTFKNTELVQGWLVVPSETKQNRKSARTVHNWKVRDTKDVELDIIGFMIDARASFHKRVENSSKDIVELLTCLDLDSIFELLCGEKLTSGKVKLKNGEGMLEKYGRDSFTRFFEYICTLPQRKHFSSEEDEAEGSSLFDPVLANAVFHKLKQALKAYLWKEDGAYLVSWFYLSSAKSINGVSKLEIANERLPFSLGNKFLLTMKTAKKPLLVQLNEKEVYKSISTDESLYNQIGVEGCICHDIALPKGGTEAIVKSYYSVMN